MRRVLLTGAGLRLVLLLAGLWQDAHSRVRYTDIDYDVFSDAAAAIAAGGSPYERATYRYTPLLAWALLPNVWLHQAWGKVLFCVADLVVAHLTAAVLQAVGAQQRVAVLGAAVTLFNPFTAAVSTRGSCDALLSALILLTLYAAAQHRPLQSGALLGCAVHFRVYPIIHALPLGLFFLLGQPGKGYARYWAGIVASATCGAACVAAFAVLGGICYAAYGWPFVEHAYLYHISRSDPRHNFSPWFLSAYLHATTAARARTSFGATLARVAPQAACVIASGSAFWRDPAAAFFFQTMLFVAFNRVITAQYFTWWMALAPLLAPGLLLVAGASRHVHATVAIAALWLVAQLLWLATAARLEFGDPGTDATVDAFAPVWAASVLFLAAQTILVAHLLRVYTAQDWTARRGTRLVAEISTLPGRAKTD